MIDSIPGESAAEPWLALGRVSQRTGARRFRGRSGSSHVVWQTCSGLGARIYTEQAAQLVAGLEKHKHQIAPPHKPKASNHGACARLLTEEAGPPGRRWLRSRSSATAGTSPTLGRAGSSWVSAVGHPPRLPPQPTLSIIVFVAAAATAAPTAGSTSLCGRGGGPGAARTDCTHAFRVRPDRWCAGGGHKVLGRGDKPTDAGRLTVTKRGRTIRLCAESHKS